MFVSAVLVLIILVICQSRQTQEGVKDTNVFFILDFHEHYTSCENPPKCSFVHVCYLPAHSLQADVSHARMKMFTCSEQRILEKMCIHFNVMLYLSVHNLFLYSISCGVAK